MHQNIIAKQSRKNDRIRFLTKVRGRFGSGIGKWADYARSPVDFELRLNATLLNMRSKRLQSELLQLEDEIKTGASSYHLQSLAHSSNRLLKDAIYRHYCVGGSIPSQRIRFAYQDLRNKSDKVRTEYPVITSTTNAARRQLGRDAKQFDWVIVDESSQADLVTGFLALSCARHAVVVGDTRQLPYVVTKEAAEASERVFSAADVADRYRYTSESLLSCLERCITEEGLNAPVTLLREHYRCHPDIIGFCNKQFYDGELVVMTKGGQSPHALQVFLTQDENYDRSANYNHVQAELVSEEVVPKLLLEFAPDDVGIVTPYRRQADGLSEKQWSLSPIEIMTVHKYQGREKNAMVFVTCTNDTNAFLDNPNLVNVAISRAKDALVLVASPRITKGVGNLADFARYVAFRNGKVIQTEACSAFDLVYPTRLEERLEYLKHRNASGDQYSEVRVETELVSALKAAGLSSRFGYARNYPLKQFIAEGISLSKRERQFVESSAHADFLVFRKIDRRVVYEIEVNGSQHASQIQRGRDELKRSILDKAGVPHAGILTNEAKHELSRHIAAIVAELQASDTGNRKTSNVVQDS